jgi:hypothetical protein
MTLRSPTRKEAIWLACKQKSCCYGTVIPTGQDVWRISRALETPPWSFLLYFQTPQPRRDAFALDRSGRRFRIALAKGPRGRGSASRPAPCVFLLKLRGGQHRCGLGDLRPAVCQSFPAEMVEGVVCIRPDNGCVCREWTLADVDLTEEMAVIENRQADVETYCDVVAKWNDRVETAPEDRNFDFTDFCEFLLESYNSIVSPAASISGHP